MKQKTCNSRMGRVGGQAVLEGVMMRAGTEMAVACRKQNGSISVTRTRFESVRTRHKMLNLPIIRGAVNFVEMLKMSMETLNVSADAMLEEEEPGRFERWLREKCHIDLSAVITVVGLVLGVLLAVGLFIFLPNALSSWLLPAGVRPVWSALFEGVIKIAIFVGYMASMLLLRDMRRVFAYHGAEHKSVACYEAGDELTPENARRHTRFHPRCGTSFMFVMVLLGILVSVLLKVVFPGLTAPGFGVKLLYTLIKLLILPLVVGVGFEFILYAGKHDNVLVRVLSAPGLWMQRLTTREPDDAMLECAITAIKCAMPDEFPDFDPATYDRSEKPAEAAPDAGDAAADATEEETPAGEIAATEPPDAAETPAAAEEEKPAVAVGPDNADGDSEGEAREHTPPAASDPA
ncbi:MAG: DUF1385 domain-containing protein [Clostridia bacterium]|nr:DUF1385 domain-containing protein [Clostridia bacterium]